MPQLPLLVSIPHGGTETPPEVAPFVVLSPRDLFDDMDPFTREIYEMEGWAATVIQAGVARAFVDLNRASDQLPPAFPDGVVKSVTCYEKMIYKPGKMNKKLIRRLLGTYYKPFHDNILNEVQRGDIDLAVDCHTMAAAAPNIAPDPGRRRPMVCLGNVNGRSCSNDMVERLAGCLQKAFQLRQGEVLINEPFSGGFITKTYGNRPIPWIQIELNRALYLDPQWFDEESLEVDHSRITELNRRFKDAMVAFFQ